MPHNLEEGQNLTVGAVDYTRVLLFDDDGRKYLLRQPEHDRAIVVWSIEDLKALFDVSNAEASAFFDRHEGDIKLATISAGWDILRRAGLRAGLKRLPLAISPPPAIAEGTPRTSGGRLPPTAATEESDYGR